MSLQFLVELLRIVWKVIPTFSFNEVVITHLKKKDAARACSLLSHNGENVILNEIKDIEGINYGEYKM